MRSLRRVRGNRGHFRRRPPSRKLQIMSMLRRLTRSKRSFYLAFRGRLPTRPSVLNPRLLDSTKTLRLTGLICIRETTARSGFAAASRRRRGRPHVVLPSAAMRSRRWCHMAAQSLSYYPHHESCRGPTLLAPCEIPQQGCAPSWRRAMRRACNPHRTAEARGPDSAARASLLLNRPARLPVDMALEAAQAHGDRKRFARSLADAIPPGEGGYGRHRGQARLTTREARRDQGRAGFAPTFLRDGKAQEEGSTLIQPRACGHLLEASRHSGLDDHSTAVIIGREIACRSSIAAAAPLTERGSRRCRATSRRTALR